MQPAENYLAGNTIGIKNDNFAADFVSQLFLTKLSTTIGNQIALIQVTCCWKINE